MIALIVGALCGFGMARLEINPYELFVEMPQYLWYRVRGGKPVTDEDVAAARAELQAAWEKTRV